MDNKGKFTITNEEGKELECEVLFTFDSDEFKKSYIVFTDGTLDDNGNIKVCADFSIHLLSVVKINQDSLLAKAGLAYEKNIWDEDDAI